MPEQSTLLQQKVESGSDHGSFRNAVIQDYWICCVSREVSILGRKEVLTGKAKFGILGDGKEVPQVALARVFEKGDWRAGYYRDQTMMFALGRATVESYFAQLYADVENDPWTGGRQMNAHFASPIIDADGAWNNHVSQYNSSADVSPTAGQMARSVGLALASKFYRQFPDINGMESFSERGNEVCHCTIGDASTSEGVFWEAVNAAAVMQIPLAVSVWDDGYGISVPKELQTVKSSISKALEGFLADENGSGIHIYKCKAWDYPGLCETYERGVRLVRETHTPAVFHIEECTQPQGHSTSGSHERYKSKERLQWEENVDCIKVMRKWMLESEITTADHLDELEEKAIKFARDGKNRAWKRFYTDVEVKQKDVSKLYRHLPSSLASESEIRNLKEEFEGLVQPLFNDVLSNARKLTFAAMHKDPVFAQRVRDKVNTWLEAGRKAYDSELYSDHEGSALRVPVVHPEYSADSREVNGYQVLNTFFDRVLESDMRVIAFGEDVGKIGDVNQGFAGLQEKHGAGRVFDTGIREWTIVGQAIGMAMRGLRPIAEIQYLDYLVYGITPLTDDLATVRYRSCGQQQAPAIIRTRGHRLEGIWHSGSPMGMILNALRGMYVCVPRNMVQAAGMYNTLLQADDPALVIECLNGYRKKERLPDNIGKYTVPLGAPEVLREGSDCTVVTYGSVIHEAARAAQLLDNVDISAELIDVQTLLPFDLEERIVQSLRKTNRVLFLDEDVPGGATAYMMQNVLDKQGGYQYLDSSPVCLTAKEHRPPYGSDGDYFSKPNADDIFEAVYNIMHEADPASYPATFG